MKKMSAVLVSLSIFLSGCGVMENTEAKDVYKVACPLIDASNGGNKAKKKVASKAIDELKKQDIDKQAKEFLELAQLFTSENDSTASKEAKKRVKKLCKNEADYSMKSM